MLLAKKLIIRTATDNDLAAMCLIHKRAILHHETHQYSVEQLLSWETGFTPDSYRLSANKELFYVAESRGRIIGFASFSSSALRALFVNPEHQRQGVGTMLLAFIEKEIITPGYRKVELETTLSSREFYVLNGYREVSISSIITNGGLNIPTVVMTKRLKPNHATGTLQPGAMA